MSKATDKDSKPGNRAQRRRQHLAAWRRHHRRCALDALNRYRKAPLASLATALVIGIVLALPGLLGALAMNISQFGEIWRGDSGRVTVFLQRDLDTDRAGALREELQSRLLVQQARLITPDEGLRELGGRLRLDGIESLLERNPLPHVIELTLATGDPAQIIQFRSQLAAMNDVESLSHDGQWIERLQKITDATLQFTLIVLTLLGLAVLLVSSNTIRLELQDRQTEIRLLELVGATRGYMLRPLLYIGLTTGLAGGLVAAVIVAVALNLLSAPLTSFAATYGATMSLRLPLDVLFGIIGIAGLLGWLGANLAGRLYISRQSLR